MKKKVVVFDGDFGNANCHTLFGIITPSKSLDDYLTKGMSLSNIIIPTNYPNLSLISGASNKVDGTLNNTENKERLINEIMMLDFDYVVIDLGAGIGDNTLDLYNIAEDKIIVATPQLTSLQNAYSFIKAALFFDLKNNEVLAGSLTEAGNDPINFHKLISSLPANHEAKIEYKKLVEKQNFSILGNLINNKSDMLIIQRLKTIVKEYLDMDCNVLKTLPQSDEIQKSINKITPFVALEPNSPNSRLIKKLALEIENKN